MIDEPYRWLETMENRREYVRDQLQNASPVFCAALPAGILLLGIGSGSSKVFELYDRQALVGLGHPADLEKLRQSLVDSAHLEAFTRSPFDVSLRRLIAFGLGPWMKNQFEQIYNAPSLAEFILAELGNTSEQDLIARLRPDGTFEWFRHGIVVAAGDSRAEESAQLWLNDLFDPSQPLAHTADLLLQGWWCLETKQPFDDRQPSLEERQAGWQSLLAGRVLELGWLDRLSPNPERFRLLQPEDLSL